MRPKQRNLTLAAIIATILASPLHAMQSPAEWANGQNTTHSITSILQNAPQTTSDALATRLQTLQASAADKGSVPVIIQLQTAFTPEGKLSAASVASQRSAIQSSQDNVLDALRQTSTLPAESVKRFDTIPFLALKLTPQALASLLHIPGVIDIQPDSLSRPSLAHSVPLIGGTTAEALDITGQGQAVAILDTGVDKGHPFLANKVISEACYSTNDSYDGSASVCPNGSTATTAVGSGVNCASNIDGCSHGTHVAGIAAGKNVNFHGVAPEAKVIAVQVFSRFPSEYCSPGETYCVLSYTSDQIKGLERIYALRGSYQIAAVNMSLGGGYWENQYYCDLSNAAQKAAIDNLRAAGIATLIASGNEGYSTGISEPGCISSAISVGSTTSNAPGLADNLVSDFSNSVNFLDLLAPGEMINSSVPGTGYQSWAGTSMATPHVAGAFALLKQRYPGENVDNLEERLKSTGKNILDPRNNLITPRIDLGKALGLNFQASTLDITQIYLAGFLRAAELGGYNYWIGQNKPADQLATDIFNLSVVKAIYPDSMSDSTFVTAIYNNVFGRSPDAGGLNYWLNELKKTTRGNLILSMIRAGAGAPDGTSGKAFLVNRIEVAGYALNQQQGHSIELTPDDLAFAQSLVNAETQSTQLGKDVIDWLIHLAQ